MNADLLDHLGGYRGNLADTGARESGLGYVLDRSQAVNHLLLQPDLPLTRKGLLVFGTELPDLAPRYILANVQDATGLHDRDPTLLDQPDRLQLELPAERSPTHPIPQSCETS